MSAPDDDLGFAPEDDAPIPYMQRIRDYYLALGYPTPYRWAHYAEVPFRPLTKPLSRWRRAFTACPPTAATVPPSKRIAPSSWRAAAPMESRPPLSSPIDRCATRP